MLTFTALNTESCCDYVAVYDGGSEFAPRIVRLSGRLSSLPSSYYTTQVYMFVSFTSDRSLAYSGFNASYQATNGETIIQIVAVHLI